MARSKVIKDFVSEEINIESMLLRLKVILYNLKSDDINEWIDKELKGYSEYDLLPDYRKVNGFPVGTMFVGNMKYSNIQLPIEHLPDKAKEDLLIIPIYLNVGGLYALLEREEDMKTPIPLEICSLISQGLSRGNIISGDCQLGVGEIQGIISSIKNKILDILLKLENEFGNLDDLDIFKEISINSKERERWENKIINIIYDNSITIGNENEIENNTF